MINVGKLSLLSLILSSLISAQAHAQAKQFTIDFMNGMQGCAADFTDYPVDPEQQSIYELHAALEGLPHKPKSIGFMISGNNHSDDLFMFGKCYIKAALKPNTKYQIRFQITVAVDAPKNCSGIGGAPSSLTLKAGAASFEPKKIADTQEVPHYQLNLDKGFQSEGGKDLAVLSPTLDNGLECSDENFVYRTLTKTSKISTEFNTDTRGGFWMVWGTDSGFEGLSTLYYEKVIATVE